MKALARAIVIACLCCFAIGCADPQVGSKARPFTMFFVPSVDADDIVSTSDDLRVAIEEYVSEKLGEEFHVKTGVPASYIAVVEALGTKKVDFAAFNTFAYVLAKNKGYDVEPIFTTGRGADGHETTYRGQILARTDSGINSLEDLKGKKFAYSDPASTSGYILPKELLAKNDIELGEHVFAQRHPNVVLMVLQGQVDAGATYHSPAEMVEKDGKMVEEIRDARMRVLTEHPDIEENVKIVALTDEVPNEPWVIRTALDADEERSNNIRKWVSEALVEFVATEKGKEALWTVATARKLVPVSADVYEPVRQLIIESGLDLEEALAN